MWWLKKLFLCTLSHINSIRNVTYLNNTCRLFYKSLHSGFDEIILLSWFWGKILVKYNTLRQWNALQCRTEVKVP